MYDDFYEPSEFDMQVEEFKDTLRESVKKEYLDRIADLERQLAELRALKRDWDAKVAELERAKDEAKTAKREAERKTKKMWLSELLEDKMANAYGVARRLEYLHPKCDKCDDNGRINYKSPQGRDCSEPCNCRKQKYIYSVTEAKIAKFSMRRDDRMKCGTMSIVYKYRKYTLNYDEKVEEFEVAKEVCDNKPFDKIDTCYGMVFLDKEKAQAFCDYLNKRGE